MTETVAPSSKYLAEAIGTFVLVFTVTCNVILGQKIFGVLSIATSLALMIYAFGGVSGGHFNPAVTLAVCICQQAFGWGEAAIYMLCQVVGSCLGAGAAALMLKNVVPVAPLTTWYAAGDVELHYTFMLVFCVLNCACTATNKGKEFTPLAIGFTVVAGGYAAGNISGGCFNPAVAIGLDLISAGKGFGYCGVYCVFELAGAVLAALLFRVIAPQEFGGTDYTLASKLTGEFIGTYFLVFTIGLNVTFGAAPAAAALSIAAALMCMIYTVGHASGAHLNPAVTIAILLSGRNKVSTSDACMYIATQLAAGVLAGLSFGVTVNKGVPIGPAPGYSWVDCFVLELIYTFVLAFVVLAVATPSQPLAHFYGLAIGFAIVVGGFAAGPITGGHFNPAVSFGLNASSAVWESQSLWKCLPYTGFQLCGSLLAAGVFSVTHATEFTKGKRNEVTYGSA